MNDAQKDIYLAWLNDAHAMEEGLIKVLEKQIADIPDDMAEARAQLEKHLSETKEHAEKVRVCVERNGGDTSMGKDLMSKMSAALSGISMSFASDLQVKNVHSSYAAEHFEIASYTVIKAAAETLGDAETARVCDEIMADEIRMSNWLMEQMPLVVEKHLLKSA
jgi:ferritin-like metal-binding protein YciE